MTDSRDHRRSRVVTVIVPGLITRSLGRRSAATERGSTELERPVPMDRFRPNIVVDGCAPHAEDGWESMTIGDVVFTVVKPCARCVITTTYQRTGQRTPEPLRALATYRSRKGAVLFGQNLVHSGRGEIRVGEVCLIEPRRVDAESHT
jgi:uncharacterized protein YcbX